MNIKGLHIELTNKCYLKCPGCSRTTFLDKFGIKNWSNHDLNFVDLKNFLNIDLTGVIVELGGVYGDPIYHPDILDIVDWFKKQHAIIRITTNGSYKNENWWQQLLEKLTSDDEIRFSIDGIPDNFTKYRINADWDSIKIGLELVGNSNVNSRWKYIPFNFNEDSINEARELAKSFNIKSFQLTPSDRFADDELFRPKSTQLIDNQYVSKIEWRANKNQIHSNVKIDPKCKNQTSHFISAAGYYLPCCYVGDYRFYYKSKFYKNKKSYKIQDTTIEKILEQEDDFFKNLEVAKLDYCTFNCPKL